MRKRFLYISGLLIILVSCRTDFDVNESWKQVNIIYALMSSKDSVNTYAQTDSVYESPQYFRITRLFSNTGKSAADIAQITDSLYNKNWVVTLEERIGNTLTNTYTLSMTTTIPKDSGYFAYPKQILYVTPPGFKLNKSAKYTVVVLDNVPNVKSFASTNIVQQATFQLLPNPTAGGGMLFRRGFPNTTKWISGINARSYDLTFYIHYLEWHVTDTVEKVIKWSLLSNGNYLTGSLTGGENEYYAMDGAAFFTTVGNTVPVNHSVKRRMKGMEVVITGAGADLYTYIQVNNPGTGIVQKKTDYTNVTNGYGIFSSRAETKYFLPFSSQTIDELLNSEPTMELGFIR